ncbi:unnamed protein product [Effrenium voratum]|nr:unnamed protein product [Effrenium voratum]
MDGDDELLDPFSGAETAAQSVLEQVLQEGGKLLYDSYIHRKSFSFAANAACEALVGELKMCFVRHDDGEHQQIPLKRPSLTARPATGSKAELLRQQSSEGDIFARGEAPRPGSAPVGLTSARSFRKEEEPESGKLAPKDGWCLESEPPRCRIDTWARACVPVKKVVRKDDRKAEKNPRRSGSRASVGSISMAGSRTPSRFGVHTLPEEAPKPQIRNQVIPLVDEREAGARPDETRGPASVAEAVLDWVAGFAALGNEASASWPRSLPLYLFAAGSLEHIARVEKPDVLARAADKTADNAERRP